MNDGGPAFPTEGPSAGQFENPGMSLRAWYAGMALIGMISHCTEEAQRLPSHHRFIAEECGRYADAMLAERDKEADDG